MIERKTAKKVTPRNTKEELIAAYNELAKQLEENRGTQLNAQEKAVEKQTQEAVAVADSLSTEEIAKHAGALKAEVSRVLGHLSDRLEEEISKYRLVTKAVEAKDRELKEIFEIQRAASSLAALIEAQQAKREEFEEEMAKQEEELTREIETTRAEWEKEKKLHEDFGKERDATDAKRREREKEDYRYTFAREQSVARDQFEDQKAKLEREIEHRKAELERELALREKAIAEHEAEVESLRGRVDVFPKELEAAVAQAVKDTTGRLTNEAKNREELLKKEFAGDRNVLTTKIEALERTVAEQQARIATFSERLEKASGQVQDIAVKAIEGSANARSVANLQQLLAEQAKRPAEK